MTPEHLQRIVDNGVDVNALDSQGHTALMIAAPLNKDPKIVEALLDDGAHIHTVSVENLNALMTTLRYGGSPRVIITLLEKLINKDLYPASKETGESWPLLSVDEWRNMDLQTLKGILEGGVDIKAVRSTAPMHSCVHRCGAKNRMLSNS
ncbi:MAG: ankyrin repeat domain-containing protein [Spirochaetaceae bacterium]